MSRKTVTVVHYHISGRWLHRYLFRSLGWVFLLGVITALYLFALAGFRR